MDKSKEMLAIREAVLKSPNPDMLRAFVAWAKLCGHLQVLEAHGNFVRFINGTA